MSDYDVLCAGIAVLIVCLIYVTVRYVRLYNRSQKEPFRPGGNLINDDEAHLLEDLHRQAEQMDTRIGNLETILIEQGRKG